MLQKFDKKKKGIAIIIFIFLIGILVFLPKSFASPVPVKSVKIYSENTNYGSGDQGAFEITKSGEWVEKGEAEVTFLVNTRKKIDNTDTDVLLVLDTSASMEGSKLSKVKSDSKDLVDSLLLNSNNKVGLISFSTDSKILSQLTNQKETVKNQIEALQADGETNYYQALRNVEEILKTYQKEENKNLIVLFLTDGVPNINTPNEQGEYRYIKSEYPYVVINGIQYEMGSSIASPIQKMSDNQFLAEIDTLENTLLEASVPKLNYEKFTIVDYIDTDYFRVDSEKDITVNQGTVTFNKEEQTITWDLSGLRSGIVLNSAKPTMTIKQKLKEELVGKGGIYPTNRQEKVESKIEDQEESVTSDLTPILADNYKVIYDGNAPEGCEIKGVPGAEKHSVFDLVQMNRTKLSCEGYQFKGWKIVEDNVDKITSSKFKMPESDVTIRGTWSKVTLQKKMDGKIAKVQTIYEMMRDMSTEDTTTNGVHQLESTKEDSYPVYYYHGTVDNNIIFGDFCWKIVRTTDTGGVKIVYNGTPGEDGSCKSTGDASMIGSSVFKSSVNSPADVGYMYGTRYAFNSKNVLWYSLIGKNLSYHGGMDGTNYYYGDGVTYQEGTGYTLENAEQKSYDDNYSKLQGYYTCLSAENRNCKTVYWIESTTTSSMYIIYMENGETYESLLKQASEVEWVFGNDVEYQNGTYILKDPIKICPLNWESEAENMRNGHHYTCAFSNTEVCSSIDYIFLQRGSNSPAYITLTEGKKVDDALNEMFQNQTDSPVKQIVDSWYLANMTKYTDYLEDTVWCTDRSIYQKNGWDKDGDVTKVLYFRPYERNDKTVKLDCERKEDSFSVNDEIGNGLLEYPVGLLTADEQRLAGGNNYANANIDWWLGSSYTFDSYARVYYVDSNGNLSLYSNVASPKGVRPAISLRSGMRIDAGDGTEESPYHVMME